MTTRHVEPVRRGPRFAAAWWGEVVRVAPHGHAHWPALRVGISVTAPLAIAVGVGHVGWAPYAVFGAIASAYGKQLDYGERLRAQVETGAALTAAVVLGTAVGVIAPASWLAVLAMAAASVSGLLLTATRGWLPVPSLFLVFAVGTLSSYRHRASDLVLALVLASAAAGLAVALGQVGRRLTTSRRPRSAAPPREQLRSVLRRPGARADALVHAAAPLLAGLVAVAAHQGHPYWAAVTATVPLVGPSLASRVGRATLRTLGTLAGVLLAAVLIDHAGSPWVLVVDVAVLQVLTELFVARNYGIAVVAITPMALILSHLGSPEPVGRLVSDRVIETVLGAVVAVVVVVAVHLRTTWGPTFSVRRSTRRVAPAARTGGSAPGEPRP